MTNTGTTRYEFADIAIDLPKRQLTRGGQEAAIEPKSFRLLVYLIENRERAVSKDELFANLWGGVAVTDNALTRVIAQIRKALGDDPKQPRYIETLPTLGYRFVAEVKEIRSENPAPPQRGANRLGWSMIGAASLAIAVWVVGSWRTTEATGPVILETEQFTTTYGLDMTPSFSPDGKSIVYSSDDTGTQEIYIRSRSLGARDLQLTRDGNENLGPRFSPDRQFVVYWSLKAPGVYRVPALGGTPRRLTNFGAHPAWSPDGSKIAFATHGPAAMSAAGYNYQAPATSNIWIVSADGGEPRRITTAEALRGGQSFPSWSPDGSEIRFINYSREGAAVYTYRVAGGELTKRFISQMDNFGSATFSADNRAMYYIRSHTNGDIGIWRTRLDPATLRPLGDAEAIMRPSVGMPRDIALSPDGTQLALSVIVDTSKLMIVDMQRGLPKGSARTLNRRADYRYAYPSFSPDGSKIAFSVWRKGRNATTWIMNAEGGETSLVGPESENWYFPRFSPDGREIFTVGCCDGIEGAAIQSVSLTDNAARKVARLPAGNMFDIRRDAATSSEEAAYMDDIDGVPQLWTQNLSTGARKQLTFGRDGAGYPRYSRDGKFIAFETMTADGFLLSVIPAAGGKVEILLRRPGLHYVASWSGDDDRIYFAGRFDGVWNVYSISRSTREVRALTNYRDTRTYVRFPAISPREDRLVYEFNESKGNVFVADLRR